MFSFDIVAKGRKIQKCQDDDGGQQGGGSVGDFSGGKGGSGHPGGTDGKDINCPETKCYTG